MLGNYLLEQAQAYLQTIVLGEQRKLSNLGEGGSQTALDQARVFIERQDVLKRTWQLR